MCSRMHRVRVPLSVFLCEFAGWLNLNEQARAGYKNRQRRRALALEMVLEKRRMRTDLARDLDAGAAAAEEGEDAIHMRGTLCGGLYSCVDCSPVGGAGGMARSTKDTGVAAQAAATLRAQRVSIAVGAATETKGAMAFLIGQAAAASRAKVRQAEREQQRLNQESCVKQERAEQGAAGNAALGGVATDEPPADSTPPQQQTPPPSPPTPPSPSSPPSPPSSSSSAPEYGKSPSSSAPEYGKSPSSSAPEYGKSSSSSAPEYGKSSSSSAPEFGKSSSAPTADNGQCALSDTVVPLAVGDLEQSADHSSESASIGEVMEEEELPASNMMGAARPKSPWGTPKSFATEPLQPTAMPTEAKAYEESPLVPIGSTTCLVAAEDYSANATHASTTEGAKAAVTCAMGPLPTLSWEEQAEEARRLQVAATLYASKPVLLLFLVALSPAYTTSCIAPSCTAPILHSTKPHPIGTQAVYWRS